MVQVFCDRCGRVITGMSAHERVSVTASGAGGGEIAKLDFCAFCADWAINTLMHRAMRGRSEEKQERTMDNLEFDLTAGKLRRKGEGDEKNAKKGAKKDGAAWTAELLRKEEKKAPEPKLVVKGPGAAEKRAIFEKLLHYKQATGPGWAARIEKASGGAVGSETLRAIVVDGLMVDIHVWRVIERGLSDLGAMEKKA